MTRIEELEQRVKKKGIVQLSACSFEDHKVGDRIVKKNSTNVVTENSDI